MTNVHSKHVVKLDAVTSPSCTGIFSDWSIYTMKGDVSLHDFYSETGLAYGLGLYTKTELTWDEDATLSIYNMAAGSERGEVDTDSLSHPYNPAQAEPVHAIWQYNQSTYDKTFYSSMTGRPAVVEMSCIVGVDGYNLDDKFGEYEADNTDCDDFMDSTTLSSVNLMKRGVRVGSASQAQFEHIHLGYILWAALAVATLFGLWTVCKTGLSSSYQKLSTSNEAAPLLYTN